MEKEFEEAKRKTPLEHFQDIKELETADGPLVTVEDLLPFKCEKVEKALLELKQIKEAEPSEAMIKLRELRAKPFNWETLIKVLDEIEQALLNAQELKKKNAEYKEALRIIKEKDVNIWYLTVSTKVKNYKDYNSFLMNDRGKRQLTEEEFNLVRRVLK